MLISAHTEAKVATLIALMLVVALALPAAASAQLTDPTLDQYAPSTQQIQHQVNGGGGGGSGGSGGGAGGSGQASPGGDGGQVPQAGDGGQASPGDGGQVPQAGDGGQVPQAGDGGQASPGDGGQVDQGSGGAGTPAHADQGGLDDRVVNGVPLTGFDLVALALAAAVIAGTAVLLRRLSRRPRLGA